MPPSTEDRPTRAEITARLRARLGERYLVDHAGFIEAQFGWCERLGFMAPPEPPSAEQVTGDG